MPERTGVAPGEHYRFGPFDVDVAERELRRDGEIIALTAKTFDLLLILVQGAGRTFTKSELLASLWPGTAVEESSLSQTVFLLRKALGESSDGSDYIRTVPRRGYKFVGSVGRQDASGTSAWPAAADPIPSLSSRIWPPIAVLAILALGALVFVHFREEAPEARVLRATILPPEKTLLTLKTSGPPALSPDGRRIVFSAAAADGTSRLWIRSLDASAAQPLRGTERGSSPFWSPDSRWVAFFADGKLKKIDTQGGPPIAMADAPVPFGGSWSRNGTILFSPNWDALQKISSSGGKATAVGLLDAAVGFAVCCPWFLPDGEHYLFAAQTSAGNDRRVNLRVGSLNSAASQVIGEGANAVYAAGRLLYLSGSTLMAQPFDVNAAHTIGEAVPVAERVEHCLGSFPVGVFSVSSTGLLAYQEGSKGGVQLTWFDRTGRALGTVGEPGAFYDIEASPDRKRLAASAADATVNVDVWTYDLVSSLPTRFTFDPSAEFRAVWSPDGASIVFNSDRSGHFDLYRKSANGAGAEELLYADTKEKYPVSWSRDGKFLLYSTGVGVGGDGDLWVLPLKAGPGAPATFNPRPFLQTRSHQIMGQFSPDGRWVAYESDTPQGSEIYVVPFSRPAEKRQISPNGGARPRWRQDGKEIFYLTPTGRGNYNGASRLMAAEVTIKEDTVEVGAIRELFGGIASSPGYLYDVSADGQHILAAVPTASEESPEPITLVQNWPGALKK